MKMWIYGYLHSYHDKWIQLNRHNRLSGIRAASWLYCPRLILVACTGTAACLYTAALSVPRRLFSRTALSLVSLGLLLPCSWFSRPCSCLFLGPVCQFLDSWSLGPACLPSFILVPDFCLQTPCSRLQPDPFFSRLPC